MQEEKEQKKKQKQEKAMEVKRVVEKWEIQNKKEEATKSEKKAKKLVSLKFHKWVHVCEKKVGERILTKKIWNYTIELEERSIFCPKRREVYEFINKQLRKGYIRPSELS